jgi:hypothetical protein
VLSDELVRRMQGVRVVDEQPRPGGIHARALPQSDLHPDTHKGSVPGSLGGHVDAICAAAGEQVAYEWHPQRNAGCLLLHRQRDRRRRDSRRVARVRHGLAAIAPFGQDRERCNDNHDRKAPSPDTEVPSHCANATPTDDQTIRLRRLTYVMPRPTVAPPAYTYLWERT